MQLRFEVDLDGTADELARLQEPPTRRLEAVLATTFATTEARVHVITGKLLASGRVSSDFNGDVWTGTLEYDRDPGIFELARGPKKTKHHGGTGDSHFFFDPVEARWPGDWTTGDSYQLYTKAIQDWLEG
jgi:hypothetical protein